MGLHLLVPLATSGPEAVEGTEVLTGSFRAYIPEGFGPGKSLGLEGRFMYGCVRLCIFITYSLDYVS